MICKLCGKENPDGTAFCDGCGCSFETGEGKIEEVMAAGETPESDKVPDAEAETAAAEEAPAPDGTAAFEQPAVLPAPPKVSSHMALAVVTTVLFFNWMLGIPAIVFARECELAAQQGLWDLAQRFSRRAVSFVWVGVALNIAVAAFLTLAYVVFSSVGGSLLMF